MINNVRGKVYQKAIPLDNRVEGREIGNDLKLL